MKRVFRHEKNTVYWDRRWLEAGDDASEFDDLSIYPIRYAEQVVVPNPGRILEIGCGLGRLVKHYHGLGRQIVGVERSLSAVHLLNCNAPHLDVRAGDALALDFSDCSFDIALAFGVYHNFESSLEKGIAEVSRVLKPDGHFVISMRPNNLEMRLNELYWKWKNRSKKGAALFFHKLLIEEQEFVGLLHAHKLVVTDIHRARNMSILYRLPVLRYNADNAGGEKTNRAKGYRLNAVGKVLDKALTAFFPRQFCNVLVFQGRKI